MASLGFQFDANAPENQNTLPDGEYEGVVISSETKPTKNNTGEMANFTVQIANPESFRNRQITLRFNVVNQNSTAQQIGRAQLSQLCRAVGVLTPKDTSELHGKLFRFRASIDKKDNTQNRFTNFASCNPAATMAAMPPPSVQQPQTGSVANPFARA